jgi:putative transcriptional regulator
MLSLCYWGLEQGRRLDMKLSYDKLWRIMKNNKMKKSDLAKAAEISGYTMTKLNNDEPVSLEVIIRLCKIFHCDIGDLVEAIEE